MPETQENEVPQTPVAPPPGVHPPPEKLPEPVEVDLTPEDVAGVAPEESAPEEPRPAPKKKGVPPSVRIGQLTSKVRTTEAELEAERSRREANERELAALRARFVQTDAANLANYDARIALQVEQAKQKHRAAIESGDPDRQTEAQVELARAVAEKTNLDNWKATQRSRPTQPAPAAQMPQEPVGAPTPQAVNTQRWIAENSWFHPQSPEYDPEMAAAANEFATKLNRQLKGRGEADKIGTDEYFDQIMAHVRPKFAEYFGEEAEETPTPPRRAVSPVAGVTRQAGQVQSTGATATRVVLTAEERAMAESMAGVLKHPNGVPLTTPELHRAYAIQKLKLNSRKAG